jgi:hypothetical protein
VWSLHRTQPPTAENNHKQRVINKIIFGFNTFVINQLHKTIHEKYKRNSTGSTTSNKKGVDLSPKSLKSVAKELQENYSI